MNAQGDNFFVSQSHTKGDGGGWQSAQVDWIPCCRRVKWWRLMMQARTKVFWIRPETSTQCVTDRGHKKSVQQDTFQERCLENIVWMGTMAHCTFSFSYNKNGLFQVWRLIMSRKISPKKRKRTFYSPLSQQKKPVKVVPVVGPANSSRCFVCKEKAFG